MFFMLNSTEHEISLDHKNKNTKNLKLFLCLTQLVFETLKKKTKKKTTTTKKPPKNMGLHLKGNIFFN